MKNYLFTKFVSVIQMICFNTNTFEFVITHNFDGKVKKIKNASHLIKY